MKLKSKKVGVLFSLIIGYLVIFYAAHEAEVFLPAIGKPNSKEITIIIDAGHGGIDSGCVSIDGYEEKHINLNILLKLRDLCNVFGYNVVTTRSEDISIHDDGIEGLGNQKRSDMANRLEIFNSYDNAVAISIHQNQFTDSKYSGAQMFYSDKNALNELLARSMQEAFIANIQPENKREIKVSGEELFLLNNSRVPAVMVECGFLSNFEESKLLQDDEYQTKVSMTIFQGLNNFILEKMDN